MNGAWIAVACAEHVRRGRSAGFMQVCHGKGAPLRRLRPGDGIVYYSPTIVFGSKRPYRAFTASGVVRDGDPYEVDAASDFRPWRRAVDWDDGREIVAADLLPDLSIGAVRRNWAFGLRFGLMALPVPDYAIIRAALTASPAEATRPT